MRHHDPVCQTPLGSHDESQRVVRAASLMDSAQPWRCAFHASGCWALILDAEGRNIAEVHRPALAAGPIGREHTFAQAVMLMRAAPGMHKLLQEIASCEDAEAFSGRGGLRERARELLAQCP